MEDNPDERDLRCPLCSSEPILARYGIDKDGILYVHIKVYKARQIKHESFVRGGEVTLRCYRCDRYHVVRIRQNAVVLDRTRRPRPDLTDNTDPDR
jgi:uncharacterized C2H2 Zn-finger protein